MKDIQNFPYSDDNKRYHTWNYDLKQRYHQKVFKVALNAGFTCPNRDGTCGIGGCTFCGSLGSGETAGDLRLPLQEQFEQQQSIMRKKWKNGGCFAYFQAFTNTYAPLSILKETFQPFADRSDVLGLSIATRADCLPDDTIAYLQELTKTKEIWVELGLQSIHDSTAILCNRGHTYAQFLDAIQRLSHTKIKISVHLINSLPQETKQDMLESAQALAKQPIHAVKLHMLHIMKDTAMYEQYQRDPFPLLTQEDYVDIVIKQLEVLPAEIIIQRLTGDGFQKLLAAPDWTRHKIQVLNHIDKEMKRRDTWQGKYQSGR